MGLQKTLLFLQIVLLKVSVKHPKRLYIIIPHVKCHFYSVILDEHVANFKCTFHSISSSPVSGNVCVCAKPIEASEPLSIVERVLHVANVVM